MKKRILIIGESKGKSWLANLISNEMGVPVVDGITRLDEVKNTEGVYVSNEVCLFMSNIDKLQGIRIIHII